VLINLVSAVVEMSVDFLCALCKFFWPPHIVLFRIIEALISVVFRISDVISNPSGEQVKYLLCALIFLYPLFVMRAANE
jgi:hypothetical protein